MNYFEKLFHACAITWGVAFLLGFTGLAQADDYRHKTTTEFNVNGTGYYGRLAVTGDFNNDGRDEMVYLRMSPKYMDYNWSSKPNVGIWHMPKRVWQMLIQRVGVQHLFHILCRVMANEVQVGT